MSGSDRDRLDGRRALVTGGSKGSGKAVVERLREMGADVYVTARTMPDGYEHPDRFIEADMLTMEGTDAVAAEIAEVGGTLDILVHVAYRLDNIVEMRKPVPGVETPTDEVLSRGGAYSVEDRTCLRMLRFPAPQTSLACRPRSSTSGWPKRSGTRTSPTQTACGRRAAASSCTSGPAGSTGSTSWSRMP
jgi:hypothetical protein